MEHLQIKRRIIGQHARRIVVNFKPRRNGLNRNSLVLVSDDPVQLCRREMLAVRRSGQIEIRKLRAHLRNRRAAAEQITDELKLRHIFHAARLFLTL